MTKQLTTNTSTTISSNTLLPSAPNTGSSAVGPLSLSPVASPASNATSPHSQSGASSAEAVGSGSSNSSSSGIGNAISRQGKNVAGVTLLPKSTISTSGATVVPTTAVAVTTTQTSGTLNDTNGRSAALERAYVHDVYEHCEEPTGPVRPRVAQFLNNLEPGSVVCDVGCGSGRYLTQVNPAICTVGVDRCYRLSRVARERGGEVTLCDNLELPFRDESFDAVLSLAVVHHFATTERRVSALRELARILRIGGRVVITVWALEQRHRRFESQDVLIPWQPPKNRNLSYSDEEDDDSFLPPYHAYTEDSTNSSRSAGDGDSSSLSSSSPGESCYSFVRRAIQKLAGGRKHPWFLDSWTSKETKNDSSLDYEDARDLPIELRRLEDFEDFPDPPLSAGLKSRSLGSILNPPPRQIVRSRSSVPSLGGTLLHLDANYKANPAAASNAQNAQFLSTLEGHNGAAVGSASTGHSPTNIAAAKSIPVNATMSRRPKLIKQKQSLCDEDYQLPENPFHMISSYNSSSNSVSSSLYLRSGCYYSSTSIGVAGATNNVNNVTNHHHPHHQPTLTARQMMQASIFLRKQSSLNEELMAGNRIREKERVRKRIQKQMSLNEAFLCRSAMFSKRLQVIREGFTRKIKSSTGSLERVTKNGLNKLVQNLTTHGAAAAANAETSSDDTAQSSGSSAAPPTIKCAKHQHYHHHHHHYHHYLQQQQIANSVHHHQSQNQLTGQTAPYTATLQKQMSLGGGGAGASVGSSAANKYAGPVTYCNSAECTTTACYCSTYHYAGCNSFCATGDCAESSEEMLRRQSRESGSDSSKDSSLQSDTSIESEDSFASVIFIPKPEQHQQQLNYQQQHQNSNSSSSNSSSSNGGGAQQCEACSQLKNGSGETTTQLHCKSINGCTHYNGHQQHHQHQHQQQQNHKAHCRLPSMPTSPLIMPCPPTPAHSPAATQTAVTSPPQSVAAVAAAMAIFTPTAVESKVAHGKHNGEAQPTKAETAKSRFNFDEAHIKEHTSQEQQLATKQQSQQEQRQPQLQQLPERTKEKSVTKITRQSIRDMPVIPKFRKQQSLQLQRQSFPIVRRSSAATASEVPTMPKLMSLELFNPATDDLDSDSSEASSPDSIDSVISAGKSMASKEANAGTESNNSQEHIDEKDELERIVKLKQQQYRDGDLKIDAAAPHNIILNEEDTCQLLPARNTNATGTKPPDFAEFAEQLNAQLLRKFDDKQHNNDGTHTTLEELSELPDCAEDFNFAALGDSPHKKRNGEHRDLSALREELRERRLLLANLSTQPSLQQSPTSSTSSLSSQTRSFTIHEENEEENDERSYTLQLYENCKISKFNYKRNRHYNLNPETAYLLQDDGDIFEEDEEEEATCGTDAIQRGMQQSSTQANETEGRARKHRHNVIQGDSWESENNERHCEQCCNGQEALRTQQTLHNRQSTESWENSNSSTASLESPSQGGATTHHRYYHVFREGELDALINHHVTSLHIVSSYYERASWCVVAEKVQVWTI